MFIFKKNIPDFLSIIRLGILYSPLKSVIKFCDRAREFVGGSER